jgi:hypothetical protein
MQSRSSSLARSILASCCLAGASGAAIAADAPSQSPAPIIEAPAMAPIGWDFRVIPYGWLTSIKGTQTVRRRSVKVDASFIDILEKSDSLVALMGTFEARRGPFSLYSAWSEARSGWRAATSGHAGPRPE